MRNLNPFNSGNLNAISGKTIGKTGKCHEMHIAVRTDSFSDTALAFKLRSAKTVFGVLNVHAPSVRSVESSPCRRLPISSLDLQNSKHIVQFSLNMLDVVSG